MQENKKKYSELLAEAEGCSEISGEFIELNKLYMVYSPLKEKDYDIFKGCAKIYNLCRVNYFIEYLELKQKQFGDFSDDLYSWFNSLSSSKERIIYDSEYWYFLMQFQTVIDRMEFFGLQKYHGKTLAQINAMKKDLENEYVTLQKLYEAGANHRREKKQEEFRNQYFNFDDFEEVKMQGYVDKLTRNYH